MSPHTNTRAHTRPHMAQQHASCNASASTPHPGQKQMASSLLINPCLPSCGRAPFIDTFILEEKGEGGRFFMPFITQTKSFSVPAVSCTLPVYKKKKGNPSPRPTVEHSGLLEGDDKVLTPVCSFTKLPPLTVRCAAALPVLARMTGRDEESSRKSNVCTRTAGDGALMNHGSMNIECLFRLRSCSLVLRGGTQ